MEVEKLRFQFLKHTFCSNSFSSLEYIVTIPEISPRRKWVEEKKVAETAQTGSGREDL